MVSVSIDVSKQMMAVFDGGHCVRSFPVSTSKHGIGNRSGSNKTPLGQHRIVSKIGREAPCGTVFVKRRKTGKIVRINKSGNKSSQPDFILTRILRLEGLEQGLNKGEDIDSFKRCIYIHGTAQEYLIGKPASHGCIRMKNKDVVELFSLVKRGTLVRIRAEGISK